MGSGSRKHIPISELIPLRRQQRFETIDAMPADLRNLVNDYGLNVVKAFLDIGVCKPKHIKHLVETVLDEFSPTRGSFSAQGIRTQHER